MISTVWAHIHEGRIEPTQKIEAPDGTRVLVTILLDDEVDFWLKAGSGSLDAIWNNEEDDRYADLLQV